ncbi:LamG domain-containing protein [Croceibacterium mercuriale]|uniref:LamG domain-containing protein n=1 Tax=Croceibacterium mercuriale TaxID=1572751 RepID=UPI00068C1FFD|nr:LamG domain-containing protein [Croceibacterium mercuriale]
MHKLTRSFWSCAALALALAGCVAPPSKQLAPTAAGTTVWQFDDLRRVGGAATRVEGDPQVIQTAAGPAMQFDGKDDALFIESHPLAGAREFTIEAIFRPDGGAFEQRWLHLAEAADDVPAGTYSPVPPSGPRMLFEIRVVGDRWYLDAFATGPGYNKALIVPEKTFPIGQWHHVAQVYDGRTYRSYVDGVLQAEADIAFQPQGPGYASVGTRINRRDYFNGAVLSARFTRSALTPEQFMRKPAVD